MELQRLSLWGWLFILLNSLSVSWSCKLRTPSEKTTREEITVVKDEVNHGKLLFRESNLM